ncbi:hypothetical protein Gohar_019088, partial [Gossypium harknessii]|nr:hypothetical protein [Gossypium harknessii]
MYGQPTFPRSSSEFLSDALTSPDVVSLPLNFPLSPQTQLTVAKSVESVSDVIHSGSSSSGSFNSPTSLASCCTFSSHSLPKNEFHCRFASSLNDFIDFDSAPVRRVFSTGDLHQ